MAEPGTARWAQLTYASFDAGTGAGGWQVKQTTGELTRDEVALLTARVITAFDGHLTLPQFPSSSELDALPRRFSYCPQANGSATYLHAVQSGNDSTGRPGNVFSHLVLDRHTAALEPELHPIQLWRSPDLLIPFGADKVLKAELSSPSYPRPGSAVNLDTALSFVLNPAVWRVGLLCVLLDAVTAALAGGPRVIFIAASPDSAALWIGAASYLTSPAISRTLGWSLYERASGLESAWARGMHFVAIPDVDADSVKAGPGVVVIRESETPTLGALNESPHLTSAGSTVEVTEWSEMAQMVLIDHDVARNTLETLSDVVRRIGDSGLHIAWPLAMSVAIIRDDVEDALPFAATVILESSPHSIRSDPFLLARAGELSDMAAVSTAADLWARLQGMNREGAQLTYDLLAASYVEQAVADRAWITQPGKIPLPTQIPVPGENSALRHVAEATLRSAYDDDDTSLDGALYHLRLVDLVIALGLITDVDSPFSPLSNVASALLGRAASAQLSDPTAGPHLISLVGDVSARLRELLREIAADWSTWNARSGVPGYRHDPRMLSWLFQGARFRSPAPESEFGSGPDGVGTSAFELELAIWLDGQGDGSEGLWATIAIGLLAWHHVWEAIPETQRKLLASRSRSAGDLAATEERCAGQLPDLFFVRTLAHAAWSKDLKRLCVTLTLRPPTAISRRFALLRAHCAADTQLLTSEKITPSTVVESAMKLYQVAPHDVNWDEIGPPVLKSFVLALEQGGPERAPAASNDFIRTAARGDSPDSTTVAEAIKLLQSDLLVAPMSEDDLARSAMFALVTLIGFPLPVYSSMAALGQVESVNSDCTCRLVEARLIHAIVLGHVTDVDALALQVRKLIVNRMRTFDYTDDRKARIDFDRVDEMSHRWWTRIVDSAVERITTGVDPVDNNAVSNSWTQPRLGHLLQEKKEL